MMMSPGSLLARYLVPRRMTTWNQMLLHTSILALVTLGSLSLSSGASLQNADRGETGRQNSRFLRTFPSLNYYDRKPSFARIDDFNEIPTRQMLNGNSPVFYIRLPPTPYILVPGLGYVSPHPYNSPMAMGMPRPVMMSPSNSAYDLSSEASQKSVISLPLKFISNGRPAIIESPKKPPKHSESKESMLISGGKYSFNGRPTAVFVVRSPAGLPYK